MSIPNAWVLLSYRLPREPSTPRASLWRSLRKVGAVQIVDGLVALPDIERTRETLEWLAEDVISSAGEATVWFAVVNGRLDDEALVQRSRAARAEEYGAIETDALSAADTSETNARARTARRLRRELQQIVRRDYFAAPGRDAAVAAVARLQSTLEMAP